MTPRCQRQFCTSIGHMPSIINMPTHHREDKSWLYYPTASCSDDRAERSNEPVNMRHTIASVLTAVDAANGRPTDCQSYNMDNGLAMATALHDYGLAKAG